MREGIFQVIIMGCDIHVYIEKKKNGKWVPAQGFMDTGNWEDGTLDVPYPDKQLDDRDYLLFGFLAGVRDPTNQHFEPKGFPKDASKEVKAVFKRWGSDAHTPSYLTLEELKSVDWNNELIIINEMFRKDQIGAFRKSESEGKPNYDLINTWCSWASDTENWISDSIQVPIKYEFKKLYWFQSFEMSSYDYNCKPDELRLVFWFDN
jgi:hypothetical protein